MDVPDVPPIHFGSAKPVSHGDANAALDAFLADRKNKPPLVLKSKILQCVARRRVDAAATKNYPLAARMAAAEKDLRHYFATAPDPQAIRAAAELPTSSNNLRTRLERAVREFDTREENYKAERQQFMDELAQHHDNELQEFAERWRNPQTFSSYAKSSSHLLQLRDIERKRVLLQDYEGAEETRKFADEVERDEKREAQARAVACMKGQLEQLQKRQNMEWEAAERMTEKHLYHMSKERRMVVMPLQRALKRAEDREAKLAKAPDLRRSRTSLRDNEAPDIDLATPRTFRKMYDLRASKNVGHLELDGIDITEYLRGGSRAVRQNRRSVSVQRARRHP